MLTWAAIASAAAFAQVDRAVLVGAVSDASDSRIAGASVLVESASTGFRRETVTSASGGYQLPGLPVGAYTVTVGKSGFSTAKFEDVVLTVGQTRALNVQLSVSAKKEAPWAYKDVGAVVETQTAAGVAEVVAELRPLMTVKG